MTSSLREVVVATGNPGKLLEIRALLGDLAVSLRSMEAFPEILLPEEGDDYETNAVEKARAAARDAGRLALADDSGLEVAGLDGRPGPFSARFGGPGLDDAGRVGALLEAMSALEEDARAARFVCVAALATPGGEVAAARGECRGRILAEPRGLGGFGYDPVFELEGESRTLAELLPARKNALSHRALAFHALEPALRKHLKL